METLGISTSIYITFGKPLGFQLLSISPLVNPCDFNFYLYHLKVNPCDFNFYLYHLWWFRNLDNLFLKNSPPSLVMFPFNPLTKNLNSLHITRLIDWPIGGFDKNTLWYKPAWMVAVVLPDRPGIDQSAGIAHLLLSDDPNVTYILDPAFQLIGHLALRFWIMVAIYDFFVILGYDSFKKAYRRSDILEGNPNIRSMILNVKDWNFTSNVSSLDFSSDFRRVVINPVFYLWETPYIYHVLHFHLLPTLRIFNILVLTILEFSKKGSKHILFLKTLPKT